MGEEGLGQTGQSYIVGSDGTLRSDLRREIEDPEAFYRDLHQSGVSPEQLARIRRFGTAVLNLDPAAVPAKSEVLRSTAALPVHGLAWTLVAEIEAGEAFQAVSLLRWRMLRNALLVAIVLFAAAHVLAGAVTRNLLRLAAGARQLGRRDFTVRLPVDSTDEIGYLAESFNNMATELQETTVSRQELDRILHSLMNGVFVVSADRASSVDEILASPVQTANAAALHVLGYESLHGVALEVILAGDADGWRARFARLRSQGRLPAVETALQTASGRSVPVLFSASWLANDDEKEPGLVCVSQDISEWKDTQEKLATPTNG